jgi:hypothetical protein
MWSSRRAALAAIGGALALSLAACTGLTPVYETPSLAGKTVALDYAPPGNRTDQLIYQDLALRLPRGGAGNPRLVVSTGQYSRDLTHNLVTTAQSQKQMVVTASVTLTAPDGKVLFQGTRSATADYTTDPQIISTQAASADAAARAAHQLADTIRLAILGALAK